jgi:hypothetical protein
MLGRGVGGGGRGLMIQSTEDASKEQMMKRGAKREKEQALGQ